MKLGKKKKEKKEVSGEEFGGDGAGTTEEFDNEAEVEAVLRARESGKPIEDDQVDFGSNGAAMEEVTTKHLLTLLYNSAPDKLKMVTNTPKRQFNSLVVGSTIDRMARGEHRTDKQGSRKSVWQLFVEERDGRAPSVDGDSRHELVKLNEFQQNADMGGSERMKYG